MLYAFSQVRWIILGPFFTLMAIVAYGLLHSLLASRTVKAWAERSFGNVAGRTYRLIYNVIGLITLLPVLVIPGLLPGQTLYQLHGIWLVLAILGQAFAVLILFMGLFQTDPWQFLGLRQLIHPTGDGDQELVVSGFYRCVRHPLYVAGLIFIWLIPIMTTSLLVLNLGLTFYIYIGSIFEERRLLAEYGSIYLAYRNEVPRLVPRLGHCLSKHS